MTQEIEQKKETSQQSRFDFDVEEYAEYFSDEYLAKLQKYTENLIDRAVAAQKQMQEEGIKIPPSTGDYRQDALDVIQYSNEILSRAGLLGEVEEGKEEL